MRDRLIELIKEGEDKTPCAFDPECDCDGKKCGDCEREAIAAHLLANGVIVSPCKVGDKAYIVDGTTEGIYKFLIKLPIIGKRVKKKIGKTFRDICTFNTTYRSGSDCIVAMVNSGDYTLEQAIWVYANSCERCMNALCFEYLNGKDGYAEYSAEWLECNTECDFCKGEQR